SRRSAWCGAGSPDTGPRFPRRLGGAREMTLKVERLGGSFVARVTGVDLGRLSDAEAAALHRAYLDHKVLVIPDQSLTLDAFAGFGRRFGPIAKHPVARFTHPDHPDVM